MLSSKVFILVAKPCNNYSVIAQFLPQCFTYLVQIKLFLFPCFCKYLTIMIWTMIGQLNNYDVDNDRIT